MNQSHRSFYLTIAALLIIATPGCGSRDAELPDPLISLATPPGWTKSEPEPLPAGDEGFTVAYHHESGLTVTLYQFTRGLTSIPNDLESAPVKEEFRLAKDGIEQAVKLGIYQSAEEIETKTIMLGDSRQQAHWSQYRLTVEQVTVVSDIYVWSGSNTMFKLRCTCSTDDAAASQAALKPLLTAFGSAAKSAEQ